MPQITCPNCKTTINLENRKQTDLALITSALRSKPRTFTELLRLTYLSRKTLSLRLRELCDSGVIVKDGGYRLNGTSINIIGERMNLLNGPGLKRMLQTRKNVILGLLLLIIGLPLVFQVSAMLFLLPPSPPPPSYHGAFKIQIKVSDVTDLYAWQIKMSFDPNELVYVSWVAGNLINPEYPFKVNASDLQPGTLLLGATLAGHIPGVSGSGILAEITFGIKEEDYQRPRIVHDGSTFLISSHGERIQGTLSVELPS